MHFLLDANMPRSAVAAFQEHGHEACHVRDVGLGDAPDSVINAYAVTERWVLVTRDLDFCDIRNYPPEEAHGRLVLRVADIATASEICARLHRFLTLTNLMGQIPGRLVILDQDRVRFRPSIPAAE